MSYASVCLVGLALAVGVPAATWAQGAQPPPAHIGPVWDGVRHQPTRAGVRGAETAGGDTLDARRKAAEDRELAAIQRQLLAAPH